jgi:hypothetical protein
MKWVDRVGEAMDRAPIWTMLAGAGFFGTASMIVADWVLP